MYINAIPLQSKLNCNRTEFALYGSRIGWSLSQFKRNSEFNYLECNSNAVGLLRVAVTTSRNSDLGPAWTSPENKFNLLSEGQLYLYGINVIKKSFGADAGIYLSDQAGVRFPFRMVGKQFRIPVGFVQDGVVKKAEFIVDGGCPHHIISDQDASRLRGGEGELELTLGSFSEGQRHTLHGGNNWHVSLLDELGSWRAPKTRITPAPGPVTNSELATFLVEAQACINDAWSEPLNRVLTTPSNEKGGETKKGETTDANRKAEIPLVDGQPKVTANGTGGSTKRSPESILARKQDISRALIRKMNYSKSDLNNLIAKGHVDDPDVIPLESEFSEETMDRLLAGGVEPPRTRSRRLLNKKERTEMEPFHLVYDTVKGDRWSMPQVRTERCGKTGRRGQCR